MMSPIGVLPVSLLLTLAASALAQSAITSTKTGTADATLITSRSTLKLAKKYEGSSFFDGFDFFTKDDPTGGYVNYVSKSDASSLGLTDVQNGAVIMRADAENTASGRGRNSVRISSKDKWADGVYILDVNHMPVGCGTWPAWWTVVSSGWPTGGEIDIIEGANAYPSLNSVAYNATSAAGFTTAQSGYPITQDVSSLHTKDNCQIPGDAYMSGTAGSLTCSSSLNGNMGCGVELGGNGTYGVESFGRGVNGVGGGWYALWRDVEGSGGIYVYFWPRNSPNVPDDVKDGTVTSTSVADWGQPGANLSIPTCKSDFGNHVIVFNIAFCGDYSAATYSASGCPSTCSSFVMNNPQAFAETYWSINSLRVYTASGKAVASSGLSTGAIVGIVIGGVAFLVVVGWLYLRWRKRRAARQAYLADQGLFEDDSPGAQPPKPFTSWAAGDAAPIVPLVGTATDPTNATAADGTRLATKKARTGKTVLKPGMTPRHFLEGETPLGQYHLQAEVHDGGSASSREGSRRGSYIPSGGGAGFGGMGDGSPARRGSHALIMPDSPARRGSLADGQARRGSVLPGSSGLGASGGRNSPAPQASLFGGDQGRRASLAPPAGFNGEARRGSSWVG